MQCKEVKSFVLTWRENGSTLILITDYSSFIQQKCLTLSTSRFSDYLCLCNFEMWVEQNKSFEDITPALHLHLHLHILQNYLENYWQIIGYWLSKYTDCWFMSRRKKSIITLTLTFTVSNNEWIKTLICKTDISQYEVQPKICPYTWIWVEANCHYDPDLNFDPGLV